MSIALDSLQFIGKNLVRPECVLTTRAGHIYASDFRGGVSQITPTGECLFYGGETVPGIGLLKPNGICLLDDGSFLVAHLGDTQGGIFRIERNGNTAPFLTEINGKPLPPSNFIYLDHQGRLWFTVSTRLCPRADAYRSDIADGFIGVIDERGACIVADNIGYTNEVFVTTDGNTLYANATFARETLRFDIDNDNRLQHRKVIARHGKGIYPDGLTMDTQGKLWITSIVSNSLLCLDPQSGETTLELQDVDPNHLDWVEEAYSRHAIGRPHLDVVKSARLQNISSLAFGGAKLDQLYLGCLLGDAIATHPSHTQGLAPAHWDFDDNG